MYVAEAQASRNAHRQTTDNYTAIRNTPKRQERPIGLTCAKRIDRDRDTERERGFGGAHLTATTNGHAERGLRQKRLGAQSLYNTLACTPERFVSSRSTTTTTLPLPWTAASRWQEEMLAAERNEGCTEWGRLDLTDDLPNGFCGDCACHVVCKYATKHTQSDA